MKDWRKMVMSPPKGERVVMTEEHYQKHLLLQDELIHEQLAEISKLKLKINQLNQKLACISKGAT